MQLKDLVTQADGESLDITRVMGCIAFLAFIGLSVYNRDDFDPSHFAEGVSMIIGVTGGAVGIRAKLEDGNKSCN